MQKLADDVDAVFSAVVLNSSLDKIGTATKSRSVRRYDVKIDRIYQGKITEPSAQITSAAQTSACGLGRIPDGQPWIFFVNGADSKYSGSVCQGSARATADYQRRVERVLGAGDVLVEPAPEPPPLKYGDLDVSDPPPLGRLVAPGAAVALVGVLGLLLVRRKAKPSE